MPRTSLHSAEASGGGATATDPAASGLGGVSLQREPPGDEPPGEHHLLDGDGPGHDDLHPHGRQGVEQAQEAADVLNRRRTGYRKTAIMGIAKTPRSSTRTPPDQPCPLGGGEGSYSICGDDAAVKGRPSEIEPGGGDEEETDESGRAPVVHGFTRPGEESRESGAGEQQSVARGPNRLGGGLPAAACRDQPRRARRWTNVCLLAPQAR
jgi:hypothetical protein